MTNVKCRMCDTIIDIDCHLNYEKRKMFNERGYCYCSHKCSTKGSGLDKWNKANENVDLDKLKYLKTETSMSDKDIAKELNVSVHFVTSRCHRYNWTRSKELEEGRQTNVNKKISEKLSEKYSDDAVKNEMVLKQQETYFNKTGYTHNFKNPESIHKSEMTKLERYGNKHFTNPKKMMATKLKRYGTKHISEEGIRQGIQKRRELYGDGGNSTKSRQTKLKRYGNENYTNPEQISESWNKKSEEEKHTIVLKQQTTCLERYGVKNPMMVNEVQEKAKITFKEKYRSRQSV